MFNWFNNKSRNIDNSLTINLFAPEKNIDGLYFKLAIFYHSVFYDKLHEILSCIYSKYNGDVFKFVPPSYVLNDSYIGIKGVFEKIDQRPDFKELKIIDFKAFPDLYGNHHEQIILWENMSKGYFEDNKTLQNRVIQPYPLSNDVRVAFIELDNLLKQHAEAKSAILNPSNNNIYTISSISIDTSKRILIYKSNKTDVDIETKEFKFLIKLLQNRGLIVRNKIMAEYLDWKPMSHEEDGDFSQRLKDLKQGLGSKLIKLRLPEDEVQKIKDSIIANRKYGYKAI